MPRHKHFYLWLIPLLWAAGSLLSFRFPGDEYGLYAVSSIVGVWILAVLRFGDIHNVLFPLSIAATGAVIMAGIGFLMDLARIRRIVWALLWAVVAVAVFFLSVNAYPTIEKALSKNGSWWAYIFASLNIGLYISILLAFLGKGAGWGFARIRGAPPRIAPELRKEEADEDGT